MRAYSRVQNGACAAKRRTGEFVDFQDNAYIIIATAQGELRVAANRASCIGDACPNQNVEAVDIVISGPDAVGVGLMPLAVSPRKTLRQTLVQANGSTLPGSWVRSASGLLHPPAN